MNTPGNREAGDRSLSTADLAAAGRKPPPAVDRDDEIDSSTARPGGNRPGASRTEGERAGAPRTAADASMGERAAAERRVEPAASAASRAGEPIGSASERTSASTAARAAADKPAPNRGAEQLDPLFSPEVAGDYRSRWAAVQSSFVDDPRRAVREGDELVAQMMKNLAESFATERGRLETQLGETGATTTETLRVSLRRYRSFFERLLSL